MKKDIIQLITNLSNLPNSIDIIELKKIFDIHPIDTSQQIPHEVKTYFDQLMGLKELVMNYISLNNSKERQSQIRDLNQQRQSLETQRAQLKSEIEKANEKLRGSFNQLLVFINDHAKSAPTPAVYSLEQPPNTQKIIVHEYNQSLSDQLEELNRRDAHYQVIQLQHRKAGLIKDLGNSATTDSIDAIEKYKSFLSRSKQQLAELEPKLRSLCDRLKNHISTTESQQKIGELEGKSDKLKIAQDNIVLKIAEDKLDSAIKERLTTEFKESTNKIDLIASYQNKIDTAFSYANPMAWYSWGTDAQYKVRQDEAIQAVTFLHLLDQQHQLDLEQRSLATQTKQLLELSGSLASSNPKEVTPDSLIAEANALFKQYHILISAPASAVTLADYYLSLAEHTPIITEKLANVSLRIEKLTELSTLEKQITQLNNRFQLWSEEGEFKLDEEQQKKVSSVREDIKQQQKLCKEHRVHIETLERLVAESQHSLNAITGIETLLESLQTSVPEQKELNLIDEQLADLKERIDQSRKQVNVLAITVTELEKQSNNEEVAVVPAVAPAEIKLPASPAVQAVIIPVRKLVLPTEENTLEQPKDAEQASVTLIKAEQHASPKPEAPLVITEVLPNPLIKPEVNTDDTPPPLVDAEPKKCPTIGNSGVLHAVPADFHPLSFNNEISQPATQPKIELPKPEPVPTPPRVIDPILTEAEVIEQWHQLNLNCIANHPRKIQDWYTNLYQAVSRSDSNPHKISHLVRDILFEFEQRKNLDVIHAYIRLCPNPAKDLNKLLALKPGLPISEEPFSEDESTDTPELLKPLYAQYMKLKKEHPLEAELLLQAICSLRYAKVFMQGENQMTVEDVPQLTLDPRYTALSRHRGFLKVWEAIEDFFRFIIGKIAGKPEYEYSQRPCFFNTKSTKLVMEAVHEVQTSLTASAST